MAVLANTIDAIEDGTPAVLQGATIRTDSPPSLLWEAPHDPDAVGRITANFAIRKNDYLAVGGIDERYRHAFEDIEFFARIEADGVRFESVPDAIVRHPLRRVPGPRRLASRWEGRVIYAIDRGAKPLTLHWRLPLHVAKVIVSRFREARWSATNLWAAVGFAGELLCVSVATPMWIGKWSRMPRGGFWRSRFSSASAARVGF